MRAAKVSPVPVINAGDGDGGQHPTQALLDLYTIYRERPLDGLSIAFIGELDRGRTVRSLAYLLAKFDRVKIYFVSPPELQMKPDILQYLERHGVSYEVEADIDRVVGRGGRGVPDAHTSAACGGDQRHACDTRSIHRYCSACALSDDPASAAENCGAG